MPQTDVLPDLVQIIRQALQLDAAIFAAIQYAPAGIGLALTIVLLAGLSEALGQSIVLFVNRVSPLRFWLALLIAAFSHVVSFMLWTVSVWLLGSYLFAGSTPLMAVASAVGLAYAPQLLAFFGLIPFLGNAFTVLLSLWSMVAIVVAVQVGLGLTLTQAVITSGLGWVLIQLWKRTLGRPIYAGGRWMKRRAAGVSLRFTLADLPQLRHRPQWLQNLELWPTQ
jgi:hypothetical protein